MGSSSSSSSSSSSGISRNPTALLYLPIDIWEIVLKYINSKSCLKTTSLVSRSMYRLVQAKLYSSLVLWKTSELHHVKHLPVQNMQINDYYNGGIKNKHLLVISSIRSIRKLNIQLNKAITSTGLQKLLSLSKLTELNVESCDLDDASLTVICKITSLNSLNISWNHRISSSSLLKLSNLTHLSCLYMCACSAITPTCSEVTPSVIHR